MITASIHIMLALVISTLTLQHTPDQDNKSRPTDPRSLKKTDQKRRFKLTSPTVAAGRLWPLLTAHCGDRALTGPADLETEEVSYPN